MAASVGAYRVDPVNFQEGLQLPQRPFPEARAAFERADPARQDAPTQFYIAYSYYRQGWGRLYKDDALFGQGLEVVDRAIARAPGGRLVVADPTLRMRTADELRAELQRGLVQRADRPQSDGVLESGSDPPPRPRARGIHPARPLPDRGRARVGFASSPAGGGMARAAAPHRAGAGRAAPGGDGAGRAPRPDRPRERSPHGAGERGGAVVLLSLFAASAQLFACLAPDAGILRLIYNLFILFLLWNTLAARPTGPGCCTACS